MSGQRTAAATPLAWAVLVAAVLEVVVPVVQFSADLGSSPGSQGQALLITPAGYTFSIWSVIYALAIVYAIVALVKGTGTVRPDALQQSLLVVYLGAALWIIVSALGWNWANLAVIVVMVVFAVRAAAIAHARVDDGTSAGWVTVLARWTTGLYAGWVTAASFLSLAQAVEGSGWLSGDDDGWQIAVLVLASLVGIGLLVFLGGSWPYAIALLWAQVGIFVAVRDTSIAATVVTVVAMVVIVVVAAVVTLRRRSAR